MKKNRIYTFLGVFLFSGMLIAQTKTGNEPSFRVDRAYNQISSLTNDQKNKLAEMDETFRTESLRVRKDASLQEEAKKAKMQELRKERKVTMTTILTKEQLQELRNHQKENLKQRQTLKNGRRTMKLSDKMATKVQLTAEQKTKIDAIDERYTLEIKNVKSDANLVEEVKEGKIKELRKSERKEVSYVLTPEQRKMMKDARKEKR